MVLVYKMVLLYFMVVMCSVSWSSAFIYDCSDFSQKKTCDECFRCGGIWCTDPYEVQKCVPSTGGGDDWCLDHMETANIRRVSKDGVVFRPQYEDVLAEISSGKVTIIRVYGYSVDTTNKPYYKILNTSSSSDISKVNVVIYNHQSTIMVTTTVEVGFCSPASNQFEYVSVEVGMAGVGEKAVLKYHVPCACGCNAIVEPLSLVCRGSGNLSCGLCQCNEGRRGQFCECGAMSSSCIDPSSTALRCSGNGYCDECNTCQCFNNFNIEEAQYFDQKENCKSLGSTVEDFLKCPTDKHSCGNCDREVFFQKWDEDLLNKKDAHNRRVWINLGPRMPIYWGCLNDSAIHVMRKPQC